MLRVSRAAASAAPRAAAAAGVAAVRHSSSSAAAAAAAPLQARKRFDPKLIYPSQAGHVRIINNTTRDAQQSNLSAEMAAVHRIQIATLIDDCYKGIEGPPGVEQIWGGTIPMFDIWKRGAHPFDSLREMTALLPNTPTSMLVRSNSLNSMNSQPRDVVDSFIKLSCEAGMNVFTNFDANNDPRNHVAVAEAVHKYGQHYQAALSWAVYHPDPTIYNVKWAVNWFRRIVKDLSPHSLYVKDPSGVLTPEMAGLLAREIKAEFPKLPLIFHSHYQTGFAYSAYLEAMKNGANGVECSLGFPDGAGQPYGLSMLRMAEDFGLQTGNPDKEAWHKVNVLCKEQLRPLYASANVVRTPDIRVEQTGIAGGQRSILDKELIDAGQAHLIPRVDTMVQQVRLEGGLVCQVTPAADSYAREAMRRIRGGSDSKGFTPGYAQILYGENGSTKEPVHEGQKKSALDERASKKLKEMAHDKTIAPEAAEVLTHLHESHEHTVLQLWRSRMDALAAPVVAEQRRLEVAARLGELGHIAATPDLLRSLEIKVAAANKAAKAGSAEAGVRNVADRVKLLQAELKSIEAKQKASGTDAAKDTEFYHSVLLGRAADKEYASFAALHPASALAFQSGSLTVAHVKEILSHAGTITCSAADLLVNSLAKSAQEIKAFDDAHVLGLLDTPRKAEENTLLWACFSKAAIPNLLENFLTHYYTGDIAGFFPKLFKGDKEDGKTGTLKKAQEKAAAKNAFLYRHIHKTVETILKAQKDSSAKMAKIKELELQAQLLGFRAEKLADNSVESARVTAETKQRLAAKIAQLRSEAAGMQEELNHLLLTHIKQQPGAFSASYPAFNAAEGRIVYSNAVPAAKKGTAAPSAEEVEFNLAKAALNELIHHK